MSFKTIRYILIIFLVLLSSLSEAQRWKRDRYEFVYGLGVSNFTGDVGSRRADQNFFYEYGLWVNIRSIRPVGNVGFRYKLLERLDVKASLNFGLLSNDDWYGSWRSRNLSFRTTIVELSTQAEYTIIKEKKRINILRHHRNKLIRRLRNLNIPVYLFAGVGGMYFNPQTKYRGEWYNLQPLGTEGQGLEPIYNAQTGNLIYDPPDNHDSRFTATFPLGIGFKLRLTKKVMLSMEASMRYTLTDYIDDAGGYYYDGLLLAEGNGELAAKLASRFWELPQYNDQYWKWIKPGGQRAGDWVDTYQFIMFSLNYQLKTTRRGLPRFKSVY